jgi:hypothetical protein
VPWANSDSQNSPRPGFGGTRHLPPYSILCGWPQDQHPNGIFSQDSQLGVPKFPKLGLPRLWGPITLFSDLQLIWHLKQSYIPCRELFNGMSHATCTQGNQSDSRLLMVGSQIANLTPDLSFDHNLCFRCPNRSCEPISDIYVPRAFQWHVERFNPMSLDPYNHSLKIREPIGTLTPKMGTHLGVWRFIPSHSLTLLGAWNVTPNFVLGPHPCKLAPLVASPRLGLQQHFKKQSVCMHGHSIFWNALWWFFSLCDTLWVPIGYPSPFMGKCF